MHDVGQATKLVLEPEERTSLPLSHPLERHVDLQDLIVRLVHDAESAGAKSPAYDIASGKKGGHGMGRDRIVVRSRVSTAKCSNAGRSSTVERPGSRSAP